MYGFVGWFDDGANTRFADTPKVRTEGGARAVLGRGFGLYGRTLASGTLDACPCLVLDQAVVACRGCVANRAAVVEQLEAHDLEDPSLGALLLAAYRQWGPVFPGRLTGEFSFVILDRTTGDVLAARDTLGIKKLYIHRDGRRQWIASHLELMLPMLPRRPQLDAAQLRHTVASGFFSDRPTSTIHRGIDQLRPACVVRVDPRGDHQTLRYWRPPETSELRGLGDEDYDRLLRATLFDAVEGALPRSGDVLSELSGGLDSSSVSAIASIVLGTQTPSRRVHTVSYVDPRPDTDEGSYQRDLCARHDLSNYRLRFDETFALADLVGTQTVGLHTFQSLVAEDRLRRNRLGGHVCLTGHGGDAVLGNILQPNFLADLMMSRQWSRWWRALRSYGGAEGWSLLPLLRMSLDRQVRRGRRVAPHWLRGGETNPPGDPEPVFRLPARAKLYRDIVTLAPHSFDDPRSPIEFRHPLLDRSLVELALRLPWEQLGRPGRGRILQRRVLADVLPPSIRERTDKADFTAAVIHCFRSVVQRHPEVSGAPMLAALGVVEPAPFSRALDRALHGICDDDQSAVFAATTFECWLQANARHRPPSLGALAAWAGPPRGAQASTGAPVNSGS